MNIFLKGLTTGLILQLAIGPVFFFIINLALHRTIFDGLVAVVAVTIVDYLYITLSILGIGKLLENRKIKRVFGITSSIVLVIFGWMIIQKAMNLIDKPAIISSTNLLSSFSSAFLLTISSPMTIVFWTSLFSAKALEYKFSKSQLFIFGFSTGLATLVFMGGSVILFSVIKSAIPIALIKALNLIVGFLLIGYGISRVRVDTSR